MTRPEPWHDTARKTEMILDPWSHNTLGEMRPGMAGWARDGTQPPLVAISLVCCTATGQPVWWHPSLQAALAAREPSSREWTWRR